MKTIKIFQGFACSLTTGVDNIVGTSGNDTITADNTGTNAQLTVADAVNGGAGTDTLKIFLKAADTTTGQPTLTSIENVYINGGAITAYTAATGTTGLSLEGAILATGAATAGAETLTITGQSVTLATAGVNTTSNVGAVVNTTTITSTADTVLNLTLSAYGNVSRTVGGTTYADTQTVNVGGASQATLNLTSSGATNTVSLTNTGTALRTINVSGDKNLSLSVNSAVSGAITTVDASKATGNAAITLAAATVAGFKFTGGAGNDTITFADDQFTTLTAGTQLDGGAGTGDKIGLLDTALSAAEAAKVNAAVGFEVIGLNAIITLDASTVSNFKQFSLDTNAAQSITAMQTGSKVTVSAAHAGNVTLAGAVGVNDVAIVIGTATSGGLTVGGNLTVGQTAVALTSSGTNAAANVITNLLNADNSVYTITGSNDLTISTTRATAIGSKYDGSAATGKLSINGNSTAFATGTSLGDVIIGGSAADTLKASVNGGTLTGNAGADTFNVEVALGGVDTTFQTTTITDFTKGDKIDFAATAGGFTATAVNLSGAATLAAALNLLAAGSNSDLKWGVYQGNTYIVDDVDAGATFAATDTMVKLTGTLDLSTSTLAATVLTFA